MDTIVQDFFDWVFALSGEAAFLFALPFFVAAIGLLADWWRRTAARRKAASSREGRKVHAMH